MQHEDTNESRMHFASTPTVFAHSGSKSHKNYTFHQTVKSAVKQVLYYIFHNSEKSLKCLMYASNCMT